MLLKRLWWLYVKGTCKLPDTSYKSIDQSLILKHAMYDFFLCYVPLFHIVRQDCSQVYQRVLPQRFYCYYMWILSQRCIYIFTNMSSFNLWTLWWQNTMLSHSVVLTWISCRSLSYRVQFMEGIMLHVPMYKRITASKTLLAQSCPRADFVQKKYCVTMAWSFLPSCFFLSSP